MYRLCINQSGYSMGACMVLLARVGPLLMEGVALGWMPLGRSGAGVVPGLWKADVDAALGRIPLLAEHRWAAAVVFKWLGELVVAIRNSSPFGATSSVHAWERQGTLICNAAHRSLKLGCFRCVGDFL